MITFTLETWHISAALYCLFSFGMLALASRIKDLDWWMLSLAAVWPLMVVCAVPMMIGRTANNMIIQLRNEKQLKQFKEWVALQEEESN